MSTNGRKTYEIGLVMAGAVSAGAYTAGVLDFLLQALDEWHLAKARRDPNVSPHDLQIKVLTGASAGGMTAAIAAAALNEQFSPVTTLHRTAFDRVHSRPRTEGIPPNNKFYNAWVRRIHIDHLLGNRDLRHKNRPIRSLLDSTVLDEIGEEIINFSPESVKRPYICDDLHIFLTLTNLRGVPYQILFEGMQQLGHDLYMHADYVHYVFSRENPAQRGTLWLDPGNPAQDNWKRLRLAALATGAFPIGLAPRILGRRSADYRFREWQIPRRSSDAGGDCFTMERIPPTWPEGFGEDFEYVFPTVDGGVINNEPFELARLNLAGREKVNPRSAAEANRSILMIDPFPTNDPMEKKTWSNYDDYDVVDVMGGLLGTLINHARFKLDELRLAFSPEVYSRFIVAPSRRLPTGEEAEFPIACGVLGGFSGFLSEQFRIHDFQLGRRNCQRFLSRYFALPLEDARKNPVFRGLDVDRYKIEARVDGKVVHIVPIIPLTGTAREEVKPIAWSDIQLSPRAMDHIRGGIASRTGNVLSALMRAKIRSFTGRFVLNLVAKFQQRNMVNSIAGKIENELREADLYPK